MCWVDQQCPPPPSTEVDTVPLLPALVWDGAPSVGNAMVPPLRAFPGLPTPSRSRRLTPWSMLSAPRPHASWCPRQGRRQQPGALSGWRSEGVTGGSALGVPGTAGCQLPAELQGGATASAQAQPQPRRLSSGHLTWVGRGHYYLLLWTNVVFLLIVKK